jgi:hypothetical protein
VANLGTHCKMQFRESAVANFFCIRTDLEASSLRSKHARWNGICRLFLFLSFAYRLFLFSVLLFLDRRHPMGGLAHAFAGGLPGSSFRRRSGSSFRRAPCFRRRSYSSSRRLLLSHAFCPYLSPVASSPRSRALSSSASPVLLGFLVNSVSLVNNFSLCFQQYQFV